MIRINLKSPTSRRKREKWGTLRFCRGEVSHPPVSFQEKGRRKAAFVCRSLFKFPKCLALYFDLIYYLLDIWHLRGQKFRLRLLLRRLYAAGQRQHAILSLVVNRLLIQ